MPLNPIANESNDPDTRITFALALMAATITQATVVYMLHRQKRRLIGLQALLPMYFAAEMFFTLSFYDLSLTSTVFVVTLSLHGILELLISMRVTLPKALVERLFTPTIAAWSFVTLLGASLWAPLNVFVLAGLILPADVFTFVAGLAMLRRQPGDPRVKRAGALLLYHMFSAMIIFGLFLLKQPFGVFLIINAIHFAAVTFAFMPLSNMDDEAMSKVGLLPPPAAASAAAAGDVELDSGAAGTEQASSGSSSGFPTDPKVIFMLVLTLAGVYLVGVLVATFASGTASLGDLFDDASGRYLPGRVGLGPSEV